MADQIAVVTFTTPASVGALQITSPDITETPKGIILIWGTSTTLDADVATGRMGIAVRALEDLGAEETGGAVTALLRDNVGAPVCHSGEGDSSAVIVLTDGSTGFDIVSTIDSVIAGGVELDFTTVAVGAQVSGVAIIFAGDSMRGWGGSLGTTSTTPAQEDTGPVGDEFEPDIVVAIPANTLIDTASRSTTHAVAGLGAIVAAGQKCSYINWDNIAEPSDADGIVASDAVSGQISGTRSASGRMTLALNSTGFTFAATTAGLDTRIRYLALKFGGPFSVGVVNEAIAGSTGEQTFTGLGFGPQIILGASSLLTSEDSFTDGATASAAGYFVAGELGSRALSIRHEEGNSGTHDASSRQEEEALLTLNHTGSVAQRASWVGATGSGFTLDFETATAGYMTVIGIALAQTLVTSDTEEITDSIALTVGMSPSDTETISDETPLYLGHVIVCSETVEIADECVLVTTIFQASAEKGWVYSPGAERGTTFQGGAEAGTVYS